MIIEASIFRDLGADGRVMAIKRKASFNPKSFLAKVGEGRSIHAYPEAQIVFSQGDSADAVFFLQTGKVKITVVSKRGKEAVVAILGANDFFGERMSGRTEAPDSDGHDDHGLRHRATGESDDSPHDPSGTGVRRAVHGGYWGCMASIREVLNAASADSERCGKYGDWVRCMEKLIDADHGAK